MKIDCVCVALLAHLVADARIWTAEALLNIDCMCVALLAYPVVNVRI